MLTFVVQFGIKKGFHGVYSSGWSFNVLTNLTSLFYSNLNVLSVPKTQTNENVNTNKLFSFLNITLRSKNTNTNSILIVHTPGLLVSCVFEYQY